MMKEFRSPTVSAFLAAGLIILCMLSGCATTVKPKGDETPIPESGFLKDYTQLKPGGEDQAALLYVNPAAQWSKYTKIIVEPVQFWANADTKVPPDERQVLASYFYNALIENLQKHFTIVVKPGPDVMRIQMAITDATAATPGLRSVSVIIPQARVVNAAQSLGTGSYAFVGSAQAEGQITDSVTGERLAAAVDRRVGGMGIKAAAQWKWGDAQNAMDYWAERMAQRLMELKTQGAVSQ